MIHLDRLSVREVLVGTTIAVTRGIKTTVHTVPPGLASYLIERYRNHPSVSVTENEEQP